MASIPTPDPSSAIDISEARNRKARRRGSRSTTNYRPPEDPPGPGDLSLDEEPPPPPTDAWAPIMLLEDDSGYDEDAFYPMTSFADEGTVQTRAAISRSMGYVMSMVVQSGRFPQIKTSSDIVRDALVHWVHRRYRGLPPHIEQQALELRNRAAYLAHLEGRKSARSEIDRIVQETESEFHVIEEGKDKDEYRTFLKYVKVQRDVMRGGSRERMNAVVAKAEETLAEWGKEE